MTARTPPRRLTQAERRQQTRTALLDATIDCLVDYGYAGTTTARVAELAGVSRGAQLNYFKSKAQLVAAAVAHLAEKRVEELRAVYAGMPEGPDRIPAFVDGMWAAHQGEVFAATLELWVAARTDAELRRELRVLERDVWRRSLAIAAEFLPDVVDRPGFPEDLEFALATVRGLALLRVTDDRDSGRAWAEARARLLRLLTP